MLIKNLADAEKQGNKNISAYILLTQLIELFHICMFQLPKFSTIRKNTSE